MPGYRLTEPARLDLLEIAAFIARDDESAAERTVSELESALRGLAEMPLKGHSRPDIAQAEGLLFWCVRNYHVVYRAGTRPLEILRILHGSRDATRELDRE